MTALPIKVHNDCFNVQDERIEKLRHGRMSIEAFSLTIQPDDIFVILGDTIYALSEQEWYINKGMMPIGSIIEGTFKAVMALENLTMMSKEDRERVQKIKAELPDCPTCKYKRYKNEIYNIGKKYAISPIEITQPAKIAAYPGTVAIASTVSDKLQSFYSLPLPERKACIDCVEKHLAQAYILSNEIAMGYDEHFILFCGHLAEALEEMPPGTNALKDTLRFCLAKSCANRYPYLPFGAILNQLLVAKELAEGDPTTTTEAPSTLELTFTDQMKSELSSIDKALRQRIAEYLEASDQAIESYANKPEFEFRLAFEGALAVAADRVAHLAPLFSNMLRNRRLMFRSSPELAKEAGMSSAEIINFLRK